MFLIFFDFFDFFLFSFWDSVSVSLYDRFFSLSIFFQEIHHGGLHYNPAHALTNTKFISLMGVYDSSHALSFTLSLSAHPPFS